MNRSDRRIVILGGGFGGLAVARQLAGQKASVQLVDRTNHHLFQPLLYQVSTAALAGPNIAQPLRTIFSRHPSVEVLMAEVQDIDLTARTVTTDRIQLEYDNLVLALGSRTHYFGKDHWKRFASGLKTLSDAHRIRNQVLEAFEHAETGEADPATIQRLMTCVVIGAGPTGVELAGSLAELIKRLFKRDFRNIRPSHARVILVDALDRVLPGYPESLSEKAHAQLEELGVEIIVGKMVQDIQHRRVDLDDRHFDAETIIWTAGVSAPPITGQLALPKDKAGRIKVRPDCSLPGHPEAFAIGDMASLEDDAGVLVPGVAQGAIQMGRHVGDILKREIRGKAPAGRPSFTYRNKGELATIGRSRAVAAIGKRRFSGFPAWIIWLAVHLGFLMGMRNRLAVLLQWFFAYVRNRPGARVIWKADTPSRSGAEESKE